MALLDIEGIRANLFAGAHAAIADWQTFPWHRDRANRIQTGKLESSQALAIDVFGTIKVSLERDEILGSLAAKFGLPENGPWSMKLEWTDPARSLNERRPTQIDALAVGRTALMVIECKFAESGGGCSQPNRIGGTGAHRGLRQCNGDYALQTNPVNGHTARCALAAKCIRYWEYIPKLYGLDPVQDYRPCPFRGEAHQWMRNVVLADRLAAARNLSSAVIAAYADAEGLPTADKVRSGNFAAQCGPVIPISYQSIIALAVSVSTRPQQWKELAVWVQHKIDAVALRRKRGPTKRGSAVADMA